MIEKWKDVVGAEFKYQVSNHGRVYSKITKKFIKIQINSNGYSCWTVRRKTKMLAHAVAEAFIGLRPEGLEVCHKDGNKQNNQLNNLKYGTPLENADDKRKHGTQVVWSGSTNPNSKLSELDVSIIITMYNSGIKTKEILDKYKISSSTYYNIINGLNWSHVMPRPKRKNNHVTF